MRILQHFSLLITLAISLLAGAHAFAETPPLPQHSADKHLGNATCGSAFCHNASQPWAVSAVLQNEFDHWHAHDPHAKAYEVLKGEQAQHIARQLGIGAPHEEKRCLDCHANNVPADKRGRLFKITDGVSCEACHGGADRWLGTHVSGTAGHAENVAAGMYPTEDPVARAGLCASCHVGNAEKFVDHRLIGSGHPRLAFELDTYTAAGASHFRVTDEYLKRKGTPNNMQAWAIGQAETVMLLMDGIADPARFHADTYPELAYFDCYACHHPMTQPQWTPHPELASRTGMPQLNDAHLLMLYHATQRIDAALARQLQAQRLALHAAILQDARATQQAALALRATASRLRDQFRQHAFRPVDMMAVARQLVQDSAGHRINDYLTAEQATLALSSLIAGLQATHSITEPQHQALQHALDKVYTTVKTPETFDASRFHAAMSPLLPLIGEPSP